MSKVMTREIAKNKNPRADLAKALSLLFQINKKARLWGNNGRDFLAHTEQRTELEALLTKNGIKP